MYSFIINPNCRSGYGAVLWRQVRNVLNARKIPYQAAMTKYTGHAGRLAASFTSEASEENPVILIALGGDGTIQEVLTGIQNPEHVIFGFLPAGSGNDFCRGLHLSNDPMEALESILNCRKTLTMDIPVIRYGNSVKRFGISCGIGYDAAVCHEVSISPLKKLFNRLHLGELVYLMIALKQMLFITPCKASLVMDGEKTLSLEKMYFAAVMNQQYEGGGFRFCPNAKPDDALLDVIAVDGLSRLKMLAILPTAFWGGHTRFRGIHVLQCRSISIHCGQTWPVHIDGEASGVHRSFSVGLEPFRIRVIVPA